MKATPVITILITIFFLNLVKAQTISPFIQVDQFGYLANSDKVAVITNPQIGYNSNDEYLPGQVFQLSSQYDSSIID